MTDKLILTKEQREQLIERLEHGVLSQSSIAMLQSLPMVSGEPVAYLRARTSSTHWNSFELVPRDMDNAVAVYTSPPSTDTHITADDVTDEMLEAMEFCKDRGYRAIAEAVLNVFIKHRSEAK